MPLLVDMCSWEQYFSFLVIFLFRWCWNSFWWHTVDYVSELSLVLLQVLITCFSAFFAKVSQIARLQQLLQLANWSSSFLPVVKTCIFYFFFPAMDVVLLQWVKWLTYSPAFVKACSLFFSFICVCVSSWQCAGFHLYVEIVPLDRIRTRSIPSAE